MPWRTKPGSAMSCSSTFVTQSVCGKLLLLRGTCERIEATQEAKDVACEPWCPALADDVHLICWRTYGAP
jgi:hypothetical protein